MRACAAGAEDGPHRFGELTTYLFDLTGVDEPAERSTDAVYQVGGPGEIQPEPLLHVALDGLARDFPVGAGMDFRCAHALPDLERKLAQEIPRFGHRDPPYDSADHHENSREGPVGIFDAGLFVHYSERVPERLFCVSSVPQGANGVRFRLLRSARWMSLPCCDESHAS